VNYERNKKGARFLKHSVVSPLVALSWYAWEVVWVFAIPWEWSYGYFNSSILADRKLPATESFNA